jgi:lantibiotic duramycin-like protein
VSATLTATRSATSPADISDDVLLQSVVDDEFRELLLADPAALGLAAAPSQLPEPVATPERTLLDLVSGVEFTAQCRSTCSSGPLTIICDGTTK